LVREKIPTDVLATIFAHLPSKSSLADLSRTEVSSQTTLHSFLKEGKKKKNLQSSQQRCFFPSYAEMTVQLLLPSAALSAELTLGRWRDKWQRARGLIPGGRQGGLRSQKW